MRIPHMKNAVLISLFGFILHRCSAQPQRNQRLAFLTSLDVQGASEEAVMVEAQKALYMMRSLIITINKSTNFSIYLCLSGMNKLPTPLLDAVGDLNVSAFALHQLPLDADSRGDDSFIRIRCGMQVADHLYRRELFDVPVLYIGRRLFVVNDVSAAVKSTLMDEGTQAGLACIAPVNPLQGSLCNWDLFAISSAVGTTLYSYFNASMHQPGVTPSDFFISAAGAIDTTFQFLPSFLFNIVRGKRVYHWGGSHRDEDVPLFLDIDGDVVSFEIIKQEKIDSNGVTTVNCTPFIHIGYNMLVTEDTIYNLMAPFQMHFAAQLLGGCIPFRGSIFSYPHLNQRLDFDAVSELEMHPKRRRLVFDTFLFNDELSMLALRLDVLKDVVDVHVLIESNSTFTGKQKPLYFAENAHLFNTTKIQHVIIPRPLHLHPRLVMDVWNNEYFSRNSVIMYLSEMTKTIHNDDIVIIADVDEIPRPDAIQTLQSFYRHDGSPEAKRAYTFKVDTYLYTFDCYVDERVLRFPQVSASTLQIAMQLAKAMNKPKEPATALRYNHKYDIPQPFDSLISPGGWHLSFFLSVDRIKRKLDSYSHQNFREKYVEEVEGESSQEPSSFFLSTEKILNRISAGRSLSTDILDNRCSSYYNAPSDPDTLFLKHLWINVYSTTADFPM